MEAAVHHHLLCADGRAQFRLRILNGVSLFSNFVWYFELFRLLTLRTFRMLNHKLLLLSLSITSALVYYAYITPGQHQQHVAVVEKKIMWYVRVESLFSSSLTFCSSFLFRNQYFLVVRVLT